MVGTWSKAALLVAVWGLFACSSTSSENDRELPRDYSQDATTQGTASDSGANADAESSDTGAMAILDSGSTSSLDSGNTDVSDSGSTNVEDAGFEMDAQSRACGLRRPRRRHGNERFMLQGPFVQARRHYPEYRTPRL